MTDRAAIEPAGPDDRLLGWRRVKDITGLSRTTAWRLQRAGSFPAPVRISVNRVAWRESELMAWAAARTREAPPSVAARALKPARAPRLPGLNRSRPAERPLPRPVDPPGIAPVQTSFDLSAVAPPPPRPRRRRGPWASPDQIDFGF
jgi:prophage regulatory protein